MCSTREIGHLGMTQRRESSRSRSRSRSPPPLIVTPDRQARNNAQSLLLFSALPIALTQDMPPVDHARDASRAVLTPSELHTLSLNGLAAAQRKVDNIMNLLIDWLNASAAAPRSRGHEMVFTTLDTLREMSRSLRALRNAQFAELPMNYMEDAGYNNLRQYGYY